MNQSQQIVQTSSKNHRTPFPIRTCSFYLYSTALQLLTISSRVNLNYGIYPSSDTWSALLALLRWCRSVVPWAVAVMEIDIFRFAVSFRLPQRIAKFDYLSRNGSALVVYPLKVCSPKKILYQHFLDCCFTN